MSDTPLSAVPVRALTPADIPACLRLSGLCGWNQVERDWRRFLALAPGGCFGVEVEGNLAGTATTMRYGTDVAWIGMVMVDPAFRRRGLARALMSAAIACGRSCRCVGLDATPMGQPLYEQMGFVAAAVLERTTHAVLPSLLSPQGPAEPLTLADLPDLVALDLVAVGASRAAVLADLLTAAPRLAWGVRREGQLRAFCLGRFGARFAYLGPMIAADASAAGSLLAAISQELIGQPLALDVPQAQPAWREQLAAGGFAVERSLTRMYLHGVAPVAEPAHLFALAGGELG